MFSRWRSSSKHSRASQEQTSSFESQLDCAKKGGKEALSALYYQFLPVVYGVIATRIPDRATAEDLTSEVFLKMVEGISQVYSTDEAGFGGWMLRIARNTIAGYYRQQQTQPEVIPLENSHWEEDEPGENQAIPASHPDYDPVRTTESRETWREVQEAMGRLTAEQQQVLLYRLICGYSVATVARMLGKNPNAIKALQFRALQSLERLLAAPHPPIRQTLRVHLGRREGGV
ncbi:MAG TPA: sigma-70 family RNA polymerase sigma factor [Ktedonobacterales bacterium]|jgi:RNA polymerase sigma-70 factor (ECF subfamily)